MRLPWKREHRSCGRIFSRDEQKEMHESAENFTEEMDETVTNLTTAAAELEMTTTHIAMTKGKLVRSP